MKADDAIKPIDGSSRAISLFAPIDIRMSTIWHIVEGRNAWHSTWSSTYFPRAFGSSPDDLKNRCEGFRTQGSVFTICAAPLAVMRDGSRILGLTPVNEKSEAQYRSFFDDCLSDKPFSTFKQVDSNWLRMFEIPGKTKLHVGYKPTDFTSRSHGGAYRLGWIEKESRNYSGFLGFHKRLRQSIRRSQTEKE